MGLVQHTRAIFLVAIHPSLVSFFVGGLFFALSASSEVVDPETRKIAWIVPASISTVLLSLAPALIYQSQIRSPYVSIFGVLPFGIYLGQFAFFAHAISPNYDTIKMFTSISSIILIPITFSMYIAIFQPWCHMAVENIGEDLLVDPVSTFGWMMEAARFWVFVFTCVRTIIIDGLLCADQAVLWLESIKNMWTSACNLIRNVLMKSVDYIRPRHIPETNNIVEASTTPPPPYYSSANFLNSPPDTGK